MMWPFKSEPVEEVKRKPLNEDRPRRPLNAFSHDDALSMDMLDAPYYLIKLNDEIKQLRREIEELRCRPWK